MSTKAGKWLPGRADFLSGAGGDIIKTHHLALAEHKPFEEGKEDTPKVTIVEELPRRALISDTEEGDILRQEINDLRELLYSMRAGTVKR